MLDEIQTKTLSLLEPSHVDAFVPNISRFFDFDFLINTNHFSHKIDTKVGNTALTSNNDHGIKIEF